RSEVLLPSSRWSTGRRRVVSMKKTSRMNTTSISGVIRIGMGRLGRGSTSCMGKGRNGAEGVIPGSRWRGGWQATGVVGRDDRFRDRHNIEHTDQRAVDGFVNPA